MTINQSTFLMRSFDASIENFSARYLWGHWLKFRRLVTNGLNFFLFIQRYCNKDNSDVYVLWNVVCFPALLKTALKCSTHSVCISFRLLVPSVIFRSSWNNGISMINSLLIWCLVYIYNKIIGVLKCETKLIMNLPFKIAILNHLQKIMF